MTIPYRPLALAIVISTLLGWSVPALGSGSAWPWATLAASDAAAIKKGDAILARAEAHTTGLKDFVCRLRARVSISVMPTVGLTGKVYFKKPRHVKVDLENLPRFVKAYKQQFSGLSPTRHERADYVARYVKDDTVEGRLAYVVTLTPRDPANNLRIVTMWFDSQDYTVPGAVLKYADGTTVNTRTHFTRVGTFMLPHDQAMQFDLPHLSATAEAVYTGYQLNVGLSDAVFSGKKINE